MLLSKPEFTTSHQTEYPLYHLVEGEVVSTYTGEPWLCEAVGVLCKNPATLIRKGPMRGSCPTCEYHANK